MWRGRAHPPTHVHTPSHAHPPTHAHPHTHTHTRTHTRRTFHSAAARAGVRGPRLCSTMVVATPMRAKACAATHPATPPPITTACGEAAIHTRLSTPQCQVRGGGCVPQCSCTCIFRGSLSMMRFCIFPGYDSTASNQVLLVRGTPESTNSEDRRIIAIKHKLNEP